MKINNISLNKFENNRTRNENIFANNKFEKNNISFKGGLPSKVYDRTIDGLAKALGKYADTSFVKKTVDFANGNYNGSKVLNRLGKFLNIKEKWFQHAVALESIYLTSFYMYNTKKSKNIPEEQKKPMMVNQALVTTLCTALAYTIDNKITKQFNKIKHVFTASNVIKIAEKMKDDVAIAKKMSTSKGEIENAIKMPLKTASAISNGISKLKSVLVFGFIYRYFSPVFITPIANRISEYLDTRNGKDNKTVIAKR